MCQAEPRALASRHELERFASRVIRVSAALHRRRRVSVWSVFADQERRLTVCCGLAAAKDAFHDVSLDAVYYEDVRSKRCIYWLLQSVPEYWELTRPSPELNEQLGSDSRKRRWRERRCRAGRSALLSSTYSHAPPSRTGFHQTSQTMHARSSFSPVVNLRPTVASTISVFK